MIKSLSIVIPYFNENKRISKSLKKIKKFITDNKKIKTEVILVDDGSFDNSLNQISNFKKKNKSINLKFKTFKLPKNKGKGSALKLGISKAKYDWILTSDMDLSVDPSQLIIWQKKDLIGNNDIIFFGSREVEGSAVDTKLYRKILGSLFRVISQIFLGIRLRDTQCGFKLYKKKIAKKIFKVLKSEGFEHDLEIVMLAKKFKYQITELPVKWVHMSGSKLNIFIDPIKMFFGILKIRLQNFN